MINAYLLLDRDGVIVELPSKTKYLENVSQIKLIRENITSLVSLKEQLRLHNIALKFLVITNQQCIGLNIINIQRLNQIHSTLDLHLKTYNLEVSKYYFCPHLVEDRCSCRKPQIGNFIKAQAEFEFSSNKVIFIGDMDSDIEAAERFQSHSILLTSARMNSSKNYSSNFLGNFKTIKSAESQILNFYLGKYFNS